MIFDIKTDVKQGGWWSVDGGMYFEEVVDQYDDGQEGESGVIRFRSFSQFEERFDVREESFQFIIRWVVIMLVKMDSVVSY